MAEHSKIEWCDHTFNPWEGCAKVSPGCLNCYAEARNARWNRGVSVNWGPYAMRRRTSPANWLNPVRWNKRAESQQQLPIPENGGRFRRPRVFCASLADWLDDEVPVQWLADLLDLIRRTPHLDWLLLTKRPENWEMRTNRVHIHLHKNCGGRQHPLFDWVSDWKAGELAGSAVNKAFGIPDPKPKPPRNVWMGVSVEDQARADERIPELLKIPARVRFLSCEPLLGSIIIPPVRGIDWIICGGESGPWCRPMNLAWAHSLRDQCREARMPFFMKQLGGHPNKRSAWEDLPADLRVRDFPKERPAE